MTTPIDRLRERAEALAEAASIAYEYLGSITVTPNDWRFGMWEELGAALRAYREASETPQGRPGS